MPRHRFAPTRSSRLPAAGTTLVELVVVVTVLALLAMLSAPRLRGLLDSARARGAATELSAAFGTARELAVLRGGLTAVTIDTIDTAVVVHAGSDSTHVRRLGAVFGVVLRATRDSMAYAATGLGYGASNLRVIVERGAARETVTVSRLGRVRR
jgi:type II secretory pathway pseudopilin PulG